MKKDTNRYDMNGTTATLRCASYGDHYYDEFVAAAEKAGTDITKKSVSGKKVFLLFNHQAATVLPVDSTVLHAAAGSGGLRTLSYALDKDVIDVNAVDENGCTDLDKAFQKQRENLTGLFNRLERRGKKIKKSKGNNRNIRKAKENSKFIDAIEMLQNSGAALNTMHRSLFSIKK
jgi:hypothetical protein